MSKSVLPVFSSMSFIVFGLIFRSLIHFEFIFVYGVRKCSNFILFMQLSNSPTPLIEENIFSPFYILAFFAEDKVPVGTWVISGLSILLLWPIFLLLCQYHVIFMTVAMQYSLKSGRFISPTPFFFFKIALDIWSLHFHRICEFFVLVL